MHEGCACTYRVHKNSAATRKALFFSLLQATFTRTIRSTPLETASLSTLTAIFMTSPRLVLYLLHINT